MDRMVIGVCIAAALALALLLQSELEVVHDETRVVAGRVENIEAAVGQTQVDIAEIKSFLVQSSERINYTQADAHCLALNIYHEAGVDPVEGKFAVAQVTLNRLREARWGHTICDVVYAPAQFSWTLSQRKRAEQPRGILWRESQMVAERVLDRGYRVPSLATSNHYHADYVDPLWRKGMKRIKQIGQHIFYRDR